MITNIRPHSTNTTTLQSRRENQPAFSGTKRKIGIGLGVLAAPFIGLGAYKAPGLYDFMTGHNEAAKATEISWPINTTVLASTGQNTLGRQTDEHSYPEILLDSLEHGSAKTLEEANDRLAQNGYQIAPQKTDIIRILGLDYFADKIAGKKKLFPLQTPGPKLNIFDKTEKNKNRYVLVISDLEIGDRTAPIGHRVKKRLQSIYGIPDNNIIHLAAQDSMDFNVGVEAIAKKIKTPENSELLIMYTGHGDITPVPDANPKLEGDLEGVILKNLPESEVKLLLDEKLQKVKTLLLLDNCKSGAWIAENATKRLSHLA